MSEHTVHCVKLDKSAPGLDSPPYPGDIGQRIYEQVSQEAWDAWLTQQTMLINEYRLSMLDPNARHFLQQETEKFFFGDGSTKPEGYVAPEKQ